MWFMNKIANPFVGLILNSPLHGWFSAVLLLITYRGKKSGKEYTLPVQYAQDGKNIYIIPGAPELKTWWRNLKGGADVRLVVRGQVMQGKAVVLAQEREIVKGLELYLRQFPALAKSHNIRVEADGAFNADDLQTAAANVVIIRVDLV
jgi:deazaflavin-dependent oxidoreductase (nitroreductase family)